MAKADLGTVVVEYRFPWWTGLYLNTLAFVFWSFGTVPDEDKVVRTLIRGAKWRIGTGRWRRFCG